MKIIVGLLLVVVSFTCFTPTSASSFGLSPASIGTELVRGESKTFQFTVIGYDGLVEVSSEDMPTIVIPSSFIAVNGSPMTITIKCNDAANSGVYNGRIVFLAKSGGNVMAGIKAICNLTVLGADSDIVLTTIVTGGGSSGGSGGGSWGGDSQSVPYSPPDWESIFPSMVETPSSSAVDNRPVDSNPTIYNPPISQQTSSITFTEPTPVQQEQSPPTMSMAVWAGIAFWSIVVGLVVWGLSWLVDRRRKTIQ
jgi:hypothetical protein